MRKILLSIPSVALFVFFVFPIPLPALDGQYNVISRTIWCETEKSCYHEIGHKLDHESDWISKSHEFSLAVRAYLIFEIQENPSSTLIYEIMETPGLFEWQGLFFNHQAEVYARIFEYSKGTQDNIPERFREFYDWERAKELIEKYIQR